MSFRWEPGTLQVTSLLVSSRYGNLRPDCEEDEEVRKEVGLTTRERSWLCRGGEWAHLGSKGNGWPRLGSHTPGFYTIPRSKHCLEDNKNCMGRVLRSGDMRKVLWPLVPL